MNSVLNFDADDFKPHEECGVFGVYSFDGALSPAYACYNGLLALQHRGQESCGIAVSDRGVISYSKDLGLVNEVFNDKIITDLVGEIAISHVRYSTAKQKSRENAQPIVMRYAKGNFAIAFPTNYNKFVFLALPRIDYLSNSLLPNHPSPLTQYYLTIRCTPSCKTSSDPEFSYPDPAIDRTSFQPDTSKRSASQKTSFVSTDTNNDLSLLNLRRTASLFSGHPP